jgi:hypothetical protein
VTDEVREEGGFSRRLGEPLIPILVVDLERKLDIVTEER